MGELWQGSPARLVRAMTEEDRRRFSVNAKHYAELGARYLAEG
jgi:carbonic anhydrase/acetyltransferase-like protein (isoleucine patch superfamily)